jgi:hypothetical protein
MVASRTTIAVFIDWQNAYRAARRAFALEGQGNERGNFSPLQLGRILAAGNDRGKTGQLVRVEVHRGLPNQRRDPVGHGANRRQAIETAAWASSRHVQRLRQVRGVHHHTITQKVFDLVETPVNYAHRTS